LPSATQAGNGVPPSQSPDFQPVPKTQSRPVPAGEVLMFFLEMRATCKWNWGHRAEQLTIKGHKRWPVRELRVIGGNRGRDQIWPDRTGASEHRPKWPRNLSLSRF